MRENYNLIQGDCLTVLKTLPSNEFHAAFTDPPYALTEIKTAYQSFGNQLAQGRTPEQKQARKNQGGFMGAKWDSEIPSTEVWKELLRVCRPGAYLLAFGGTRTFHRLATNIEDAGWLIKDCLNWLHGQGFPKGQDISKAIDKRLGAERETIPATGGLHNNRNLNDDNWQKIGQANATQWSNEPTTEQAKQWAGYNTQLKPSWEPIILAQKPIEGTYAANAIKWGTGGLNIDGCRIGETTEIHSSKGHNNEIFGKYGPKETKVANHGRYPANLILDEVSAYLLDLQSGQTKSKASGYNFEKSNNGNPSHIVTNIKSGIHYGDEGGASRFFYCAKSSRKERDAGLNALPNAYLATMGDGIGQREHNPNEPTAWVKNNHPTVKPLALNRYLSTLIKPPTNGKLIVPFSGSGSEMIAAIQSGWEQVTGIERETEFIKIARTRLSNLETIKDLAD